MLTSRRISGNGFGKGKRNWPSSTPLLRSPYPPSILGPPTPSDWIDLISWRLEGLGWLVGIQCVLQEAARVSFGGSTKDENRAVVVGGSAKDGNRAMGVEWQYETQRKALQCRLATRH